ncbi:uncharacterized protein [Diabrotica undecimpunctata]|uniref:uncharacterized protein n=1 Tax=Diabrotica undecimpunctata TaxID=50387 RepID=UPI003B6402D1
MKFPLFIFIFICILSSSFILALNRVELSHENYNVEDRKNYPGFAEVLRAITEILQSIISLLTGSGSVENIVKSIQGFAVEITRLVSIQGMVGQIPMIGPFLQPIVGFLNFILSNAPLMGGMISLILVGLDVPEP